MLNLNMELLDHYIGSLKIFREKCGKREQFFPQEKKMSSCIFTENNEILKINLLFIFAIYTLKRDTKWDMFRYVPEF